MVVIFSQSQCVKLLIVVFEAPVSNEAIKPIRLHIAAIDCITKYPESIS